MDERAHQLVDLIYAAAFEPKLWQEVAEMGWLGMLVPEEFDGMGMSVLDMVILVREMGRHICPSPFLSTSVLAAAVTGTPWSNVRSRARSPGTRWA